MEIRYEAAAGQILRVSGTNEHREEIPVTNFVARVVRSLAKDDSEEIRREFEIAAELDVRRATFIVPAARFNSLAWVVEQLGPRAIIYPGQREHARAAIQRLWSSRRTAACAT